MTTIARIKLLPLVFAPTTASWDAAAAASASELAQSQDKRGGGWRTLDGVDAVFSDAADTALFARLPLAVRA